MVLAPFMDDKKNEELIKDRSKEQSVEESDLSMTGSAKSLNFPLAEELDNFELGVKNGVEMDCISNELTGQKNKTTEWCLFGRS
mmetsp:Transcript_55995/g.121832  ORF Transcript_55995/g.121832 Transcript_55995/m.121832 type:complete len:84 (-) Transcript_55995:106-357(-)